MTYDERNIPTFEDEDYLDMPKYSADLKSALNSEFDKIPQIITREVAYRDIGIKSDVTKTLEEQDEYNKSNFSNVIKQSIDKVENKEFFSTGAYLENVKLYGKSIQNSVPSAEYPAEINSITTINYNLKDKNNNNLYIGNMIINLPSNVELYGVNDIQDYIDSNGTIHKRLKKYELGTEWWTVFQGKNPDYYYCSTKRYDTMIKQYDKGNTNFMCNVASNIASLWSEVMVDKDTFNISIIATDKVRFMIKKSEIDAQQGNTLSDKFNNLLLSKNAYFIAEMQVEDNSNLLDAIEKEKLEKIGTFTGKNTIITNTPISFTYNLDTANLLERIEALENKLKESEV